MTKEQFEAVFTIKMNDYRNAHHYNLYRTECARVRDIAKLMSNFAGISYDNALSRVVSKCPCRQEYL